LAATFFGLCVGIVYSPSFVSALVAVEKFFSSRPLKDGANLPAIAESNPDALPLLVGSLINLSIRWWNSSKSYQKILHIYWLSNRKKCLAWRHLKVVSPGEKRSPTAVRAEGAPGQAKLDSPN
jgi:hypothetical protein